MENMMYNQITEFNYPYLWAFFRYIIYDDKSWVNSDEIEFWFRSGGIHGHTEEIVLFKNGKFDGCTPIDEIEGWYIGTLDYFLGFKCFHFGSLPYMYKQIKENKDYIFTER